MAAPLESHWLAIKCILRYLKGTISWGLHLEPAPISLISLHAFCDADWGSDPDDRRPTSGTCVFLGKTLISYWAKKQPVKSRSGGTEVEYRSLALATSEILWIPSLLQELGIHYTTHIIHYDNLSTVTLAHNPILHAPTKHIPSQHQCADIMNKGLLPSKFEDFRLMLTVRDSHSSPSV